MKNRGGRSWAVGQAGSFNYYLFSCLATLLVFLAMPVHFAAAEADITASVGVEEKHSDNFYRSETTETDVYTTSIMPGVTARAWTDRSSVFLGYEASLNYYDDDSDTVDASKDDYVGHDLNFLAETTLYERLKLTVTDLFRETREPGAYDPFLASEADRERYRINQVNPYLTYDFGEKFTAILGHRYEVYNYEDSDNSYEHRWHGTLRYNFDDRNSLEIEEQYWSREYPNNPDYDSSQTQVICRRELTDFLKAEIGGGYHDREFDVDASTTTSVQDYDDFIWRVAVTGESETSNLLVAYRRNLNDFSKGTTYFEADRVTVNAAHTFLEKITCSAGGYYQDNQYERTTGVTAAGDTEIRGDEIWNGAAGIRYKVSDWLSAGVNYEYTDRDSNIVGFDYEENVIFGDVRFEYSTSLMQ